MATAKITGMSKGEQGGKNQFEPLIQLCHGAKALSHLREISAKSFTLKLLTQKNHFLQLTLRSVLSSMKSITISSVCVSGQREADNKSEGASDMC